MLKKRNAQGLSITVIVAAVIGLIVIVVVIAVLTGRLGHFSDRAYDQGDCNTVCNAAGYTSGVAGGGSPTPGVISAQGYPCTCT